MYVLGGCEVHGENGRLENRNCNSGTTYKEQYDQGSCPGWDGNPTAFKIIVLLFKIRIPGREQQIAHAYISTWFLRRSKQDFWLESQQTISTGEERIPKEAARSEGEKKERRKERERKKEGEREREGGRERKKERKRKSEKEGRKERKKEGEEGMEGGMEEERGRKRLFYSQITFFNSSCHT